MLNRWLKLAGLMLVLTAGTALAQSQQVQNMGTFYRNPQNGDITTSSGEKLVSESYKDRDFKIWSPQTTDTTSFATADSSVSGPFYTAQMARMWLRVQVTWPNAGDATGVKQHWCRFAVQIRAHLTAQVDSLNTNPWYIFADSLSRSNVLDSLSYRMSTVQGSGANVAASQTTPLPSEYLFTAFRALFGTGATGSNYYGDPCNFWIPLADRRGVYFWAPYTTIRIRTMNNFSTAAADQPKFIVDLVGTAK